MLSISKLQAKINGSFVDVAVNALDLAYCIKPSRQSWDFIKTYASPSFYSNLGIDFVKFSVDKATSGLASLKDGDEVDLKLINAIKKVSGTFVVRDVAIKSGYVVISAMPKLGVALVEEAA